MVVSSICLVAPPLEAAGVGIAPASDWFVADAVIVVTAAVSAGVMPAPSLPPNKRRLAVPAARSG